MTEGPLTPDSGSLEGKLTAGTLLLLSAVICLPMMYVSMLADDFCRVVRLRELSIIECVQHEYIHWTGRWLGFGLEYLVLSGHDWAPLYGIVLALIALIYGSALLSLISVLFPQLPFRQCLLAAGCLFAIYWVGLASTRDVFYWLCGSIEYQLVMAMGIFAFSLTMRAVATCPQKKSMAYFSLAVIASFCTSGLHELYGMMLCLILFVASAVALLWRSPGRFIWVGVDLAAIAGFAVSYLAPGNTVRMGISETAGEPLVAAKLSMMVMLQSLPDWVFDVRLILGTVLLIVLLPKVQSSLPWTDERGKAQLRIIVPVLWLALLVAAFLGPAWGTGRMVASRTLSPAYMIFLLGWFLNWILLLDRWQTKEFELLTLHPLARKVLFVFFAVSLIVTGNTRRAVKELVGPMQQYAADKQERHEYLLGLGANVKASGVSIPPLETTVTLIGFGELTEDPKNWINRCSAKFYGVDEIRIEPGPVIEIEQTSSSQ